MAKSFLTDLNLNRNVLLNAKIQAWGSAPSGTGSPDASGNAVTGQISSYAGALYIFNGTAWTAVGTGTVTSVTGTSPIASSGGATPAISLAANYGDTQNPYASKTANYVLAAPNGSNAAPTFRALVSADIPTLNQNTTGSAAKWTSAVNLAGNSVDGSASVAFANKFIVQGTTDAGLTGAQFLGSLGTGIVKNTTTTGVLSIASAGDFPTLNQNTTGSAGSVANTLTFGTGLTAGGASFNGSAAITITPVSATTSVAGIAQLSDSTSTTSSVLAATATAAKAAYDRGSTGVTNAATAQSTADAALPKAGGTMTGAIAMGSNKITGLGTPTAAADAATKDYVDNVSAGINIHGAVVAATTGTIAGVYAAGSTTANPPGDGGTGVGATITYSATGVVTLDTSVTLAQGDRVLVKDGVTAASGASSIANGIYVVTTAGAVGTAAILTRATDADNSNFGDLTAGDLVYVIGGANYGGDQFVQTVKGTATQGTGSATVYSVKIGTDAISYTQFSGAGAVPAATDSALGIASFPAAQFSVSSGAVSITALAATLLTGTVHSDRGVLAGTATNSFVRYTSTGASSGAFDGGTTAPSATTRLNYGGNFYATNFYGNGANLTSLSGSSIASGTVAFTYLPSLYLGTTAIQSTSTTQALTGISTITGTSGTSLALSVPSSTGTNAGASITGGASTSTAGIGGSVAITGGAANSGTGAAVGGDVTITGGASNTTAGLGGSVTINGGAGEVAAVTGGKGQVYIGTSNTQVVTIGASGGSLRLPGVATGADGFVKIAATTGILSRGAIAYSDLPTAANTRVSRTVTGTGTGSGTSIAVTHGLGTNLLNAQLFDTGTTVGTATLVEVDVASTTTTTTFTFASSQTLTNYSYVITG